MFSMTNPAWLGRGVGGCLTEKGGMICAISSLSTSCKLYRSKKKKIVEPYDQLVNQGC